MSWIWNSILANGEGIYLGVDGGQLLLSPPGNSPGAYTLAQMQNKVWHLARIDGPSNGFPVPSSQSDYPPAVVQDDLNNALAQMIADAGFSPSVSDRRSCIPVFAGLDMPIPPGAISIDSIEYNPVGQTIYQLHGKSFQEFQTDVGNAIFQNTGQPRIYRRPFAGEIRLYPSPGPGQQASSGQGSLFINGIPIVSSQVLVTIVSQGVTTVVTYFTNPGDSNESVAAGIMSAINADGFLSGFMSATLSTSNGAQVNLLVPSLTPVSYFMSITQAAPATLVVSPTTTTEVALVGDTMTWYYQTNGTILVNPGDQPGIPDNFHVGLVYRVLADYWIRKQDQGAANMYMQRYDRLAQRLKAFTFDSDRSSQPTMASYNEADGVYGPGAGYW